MGHNKPRVIAAGVGEHDPPDPTRYWYGSAWCLHLYRYDARLITGSHVTSVHDGMISIIPPRITFTYEFVRTGSRHLFAIFELPGPPQPAEPYFITMGARFEYLWDRFLDGIKRQGDDPIRRDVRLWDVLLELADLSQDGTERLHTVIWKARALIEVELHTGIRSTDVADALQVSNGHLNVLFKTHLGITVAGHIRRRKAAIVSELLCDTEMPIKAVAAQIGMGDLQQFNKFVRRELGRSPRQIAARPSGRAAKIDDLEPNPE